MPQWWHKGSVQTAFRQSVASTRPIVHSNCAKAYSEKARYNDTASSEESCVRFYFPVFIMNDILKYVFIVVY